MAPLAALLAPLLLTAGSAKTEIDPRVTAAFAKASLQQVVVEVADEDRDRPLTSLPAPSERLRRQAAREALLGQRKDRILARARQLGSSSAPRTVSRWPSFPLMAVEVDASGLAALAGDPEVRAVHFDRLSRPLGKTNIAFTGASEFHAQGQRGLGTTVAVIDSTVRYGNGSFGTCPEPGAPGCLVSVVMNFSKDSAASVAEGEAHGTNVAGIVLGMAPQAHIASLNVFHYDGLVDAYVSSLVNELDALQWVAANANAHHIVSVNMSLGAGQNFSRPCNDDPLYSVFRTLWEAHGVLVAVASGNDGFPNGLGTPACLSLAVTVGAQYDDEYWTGSCSGVPGHPGDVACFTCRNGMVDLMAPGVNIDAGGLRGFTGTSMAAPHVAGAIALLQAEERSRRGAFLPATEMHRKLLLDAAPRLFGGWPFAQLRASPDDRAFDSLELARWPRDSYENAIPSAGVPKLVQAQASGLGRDVDGVYLYLEVIHAKPEDLSVRLTTPSGKSAEVALPKGMSNFVGVVGHTYLPGVLRSLDGGSADGTWTLEVRDGGTRGGGNLLEAALYFPKPGCTPECRARDCGDDGCGGQCALCVIYEECFADGAREPGKACSVCAAQTAPSTWSPSTGDPCDDGSVCTRTDRCVEGVCTGSDPLVCPPTDQCHLPGACAPADGTCGVIRKADGTGCDDDNACTSNDQCRYGACTGEAKACPAEECREEGRCSPASGACEPGPALPDGTECSQGRCKAGECKGSCGCAAGGEPALLAAVVTLVLGKRRRR